MDIKRMAEQALQNQKEDEKRMQEIREELRHLIHTFENEITPETAITLYNALRNGNWRNSFLFHGEVTQELKDAMKFCLMGFQGGKCAICRQEMSYRNTSHHHMTYKDANYAKFSGKEELNDVQCLCNDCHQAVHKNLHIPVPT